MKKTRTNRRSGFTLTEMLIVVAIIGVLVAVAIPVFSGARDKASAAQCLANRTMIEHTIKVEYLLNPTSDMNVIAQKVLTAAKGDGAGYFAGSCVCSEGGQYTYQDGSISCSYKKHGGNGGQEGGDGAVSEGVQADMVAIVAQLFRDKNDLDDAAFIAKYGFSKGQAGTNDKIRETLFKSYGNAWPTFESTFKKKNNIVEELYIQSYIARAAESTTGAEVIIFANTNATTDKANWNAQACYHYDDKTWYLRPDSHPFMLVNQTWDDLKADIEGDKLLPENERKWKPLKK